MLVSYRQRNKLVLEKAVEKIEEIDAESCYAYVEMTEEEGLKFDDLIDITAQVNIKCTQGGRKTSKPLVVRCGPQYHRAVM